MNKLQKSLQSYYEYNKNNNKDGCIPGLIGWLEGSKVITKEEAKYIMSLLYNENKI